MRLSILIPVAAALIGFANAKYEAELDARDVDFLATREFDAALERREILADLSTRDLVDALSDRLSSRTDYIGKRSGLHGEKTSEAHQEKALRVVTPTCVHDHRGPTRYWCCSDSWATPRSPPLEVRIFLSSFSQTEFDARDVKFLATREADAALERREVLDGLSTGDLIDVGRAL
ncbi:hypothetical protein DFP72DRAFT_858655 [Ephemerocybe angulata]|uniref:Uncharacterized protein n=1 Tax=Ephemerocybe angulata TaxID=980116 RepID=A0A8H6LWS7_9AGAR|nr:hypothetical protein DFP72DRAFT_858655 [Tulosesus angulatus]